MQSLGLFLVPALPWCLAFLKPEINGVVCDRTPLTADPAAKLTERFGTTSEFCPYLQSAYDSSVAAA
jgi:plasmid maintenance system antidote protein VapI